MHVFMASIITEEVKLCYYYTMDTERLIKVGLDSFSIARNAEKEEALLRYLLELQKWNKRINLVGLKELVDIVKKLLFDAFFINAYIKESTRLMDLGSGSGILGIPLAILNETVEIFSVDRNLKKIQFQRHIKRILSLERFTPVHSRIEALPPLAVDTVVAKAFGKTPHILHNAERHLLTNGTLLIMKGKGEKPIEHEGFSLEKDIPYSLPMNDKTYRLFVYKRD